MCFALAFTLEIDGTPEGTGGFGGAALAPFDGATFAAGRAGGGVLPSAALSLIHI